MLTKQETLLERHRAESRRAGNPGEPLHHVAHRVWSYSDGTSFRPIILTQSFLVAQALFSQGGCQRGGFWEVVGRVVSPFDLSRALPVGGGSLVPCSSPGPPVVKQLMPWLLRRLARVGGFGQCASPNRFFPTKPPGEALPLSAVEAVRASPGPLEEVKLVPGRRTRASGQQSPLTHPVHLCLWQVFPQGPVPAGLGA